MSEPKSIALINKNFSEANPLDFGEQHCSPGHTYGPAIRRYVLIHFVVSGCGTITGSDGVHKVTKGEAFIIKPDEITTYFADKENPWHYIWIGFDGRLAEKFCSLPRVVPVNSGVFKDMTEVHSYIGTAEEFLSGKILELYAELFSGKGSGQDYIRKIENFVETNYNDVCDVADIAKALGLERHYLARVFKQKTGRTLKMYIVEKRMEEAKKLLLAGNSVSDSATMCGYRDPFVFSKMFKRIYGISPGKWKNSQ